MADPTSEKIIFDWPTGGHNGGCLKFGPDGYLYIVTGDGSGIADSLQTGQDLSDLLAQAPAHRRGSTRRRARHYGIPEGQSLRQAQGRPPGDLGLRPAPAVEVQLRHARPATCGAARSARTCGRWSTRSRRAATTAGACRKARHPFRPERKKGPTPILPPVVEHPHTEFRSLTGGYVYHGKRLPELTGRLHLRRLRHRPGLDRFALRRQEGRPTTSELARHRPAHRRLGRGRTTARSTCSTSSAAASISWCQAAGRRRAADVPAQAQRDRPVRLDQGPQAGAGPHPLFGQRRALVATARSRNASSPSPATARSSSTTIDLSAAVPGAAPGWRFPDGTVLVKTFSLDMEPGNRKPAPPGDAAAALPAVPRHRGSTATSLARLHLRLERRADRRRAARREGLDRKFTIKTQGRRQDGKQNWHFPSRAECTCATPSPPSTRSASTRCR